MVRSIIVAAVCIAMGIAVVPDGVLDDHGAQHDL
jgi:hypothetical protein